MVTTCFSSEGYAQKDDCMHCIELVTQSGDATVVVETE